MSMKLTTAANHVLYDAAEWRKDNIVSVGELYGTEVEYLHHLPFGFVEVDYGGRRCVASGRLLHNEAGEHIGI